MTTVLHRMPTFQRDSTPPPTQPLPKDTPTPLTPAEAKQIMMQFFQSFAQHQEQMEATISYTQRELQAWAHKFGKYVEQLSNQHVLDQAHIQELTAAHANKHKAQQGDWNQLSKAQVLHQSDLPHLLAEREQQAQKAAEKRSCSSCRKTKSTALAPNPPAPAPAPEQEPQPEASKVPAGTWTLPPPPPFPGYNYLMGLPPLSPLFPSFPSSNSVQYSLPGPSSQPAGPLMPPMPPFM